MDIPSSSPEPHVPLLKAEELDAAHRALRSLTRRQREAVLLLGDGLRPADIARALHVSKNTVGFHLKRVMRKLRLHDRRDLLVYAVLLRRSAKDPEPRPPTS